MRVLFISGTTTGGSGRSQRELASRLAARGHVVQFLADDGTPCVVPRFLYEQLADLAARWGNRPGSRVIRFLEGNPGRRARKTTISGLDHRLTPIPENVAREAIQSFRPDVIIGNSILRISWRKVLEMCDQSDTATVLYVREITSMNLFTLGRRAADVVVANAGSLARDVEALGYPCAVVPSVIEVGVTHVASSRRVALVINPIPTHGIEIIWQIARELPDVPFVLQQSWPLPAETLASLEQLTTEFPNVEFRHVTPPGASLYADAKVLLVPHRIDNRPRVIAEAQANAIPVVASRTPGIAEAVGDGGVLIDMDDLGAWVEAIRLLWADDREYDNLVHRALDHSRRPEIDPELVTAAFEALIADALTSQQKRVE